MKIAAIYTQSVGPLADGEISFKNQWTGEVESNILLTGPNGCGKSTLLRAVAMLWDALGFWLDHNKFLLSGLEAKKVLQQWEGVAVIFENVQLPEQISVGICVGPADFQEKLFARHKNVCWIAEVGVQTARMIRPMRQLRLSSPYGSWAEDFANRRKRLLLSSERVDSPNVIFLDAEERRWVPAKRRVSELLPDPLAQRWLARYQATDDWQTQLESSLLNLKTTQLHKFHEVIRTLNQFLLGKEIDTEVRLGEGRLRIKLHNQRGKFHFMDELSAGEHQVLIMLYMLQRWMQPGGVVLIDEPDLHLHPSLISPLLAAIENIVKAQNGQLIITSHATEIWHRYENLGMRVDLTRVKDVTDGQH